MKIRGFCDPCRDKLKFSDLKVGDVLTFPNNPGWRNHVFLIVWTNEIYGKKYENIDEHTLIRLDGRSKDDNASIKSDSRGDYATAGQAYTLSRRMMEHGIETKGGPDRYEPTRWDASVTLEESY